jgi:hypothetical protein
VCLQRLYSQLSVDDHPGVARRSGAESANVGEKQQTARASLFPRIAARDQYLPVPPNTAPKITPITPMSASLMRGC